MRRKEILDYLDDKKNLVGLRDFYVVITKDYHDMDNYAEVDITLEEKTIKIKLSKDFKDFLINRKKSILMHELIHGRIELYKKQCKEIMFIYEEELSNDLERGFMQLMGINTQKESMNDGEKK